MKNRINIAGIEKIIRWILRLPAILLLFLLLNALSCKKADLLDCFNSTGKIEKVERETGDFNSVVLKDNINLFIQPSTQNKLVLEAGSNLMNKIKTEVNEEGVLEIRNENTCNWVRSFDKPLNVYLEFKTLDSLEYRSIGTVTCDDTLRMDHFLVNVHEGSGILNLKVNIREFQVNLHYGTADINVSGKIGSGYYYQAGAGRIDASATVSKSVYIRNWSSNDMYIWATKLISAEIRGVGNIYYKGNPQTALTGSGKGKLLPM